MPMDKRKRKSYQQETLPVLLQVEEELGPAKLARVLTDPDDPPDKDFQKLRKALYADSKNFGIKERKKGSK